MGNTSKCDISSEINVRDNNKTLQDEDMPLPIAGEENEEQMYDTAQGVLNGVKSDADMDIQDDSHATYGSQTLVNGSVARGQPQQTQANNEPRKPNKVRITTPYLTKYERARVLGTRALQIRSVLARFLCVEPTNRPSFLFI